MIAIVIVNYRTPDLTLAAVASVARERAEHPELCVVIVDNASGDDSVGKLTSECASDWVTVLSQSINGGFGWGNNQGILHLAQQSETPEFVLFLNPDAEVQTGAISALVETLRLHPECGVAGPMICGPDGRGGASAFRMPSIGREFVRASHLARLGFAFGIEATHIDGEGTAEWVSGSAFMARWTGLESSGLFDDGFFLYFEEIELMARIRAAGLTVRHVPAARVIHREGGATGMAGGTGILPDYWHRARRRYFTVTMNENAANSADRAFRIGAAIGRFRGRKNPGIDENLARMARAAALPVVPPNIPRIGDAPGTPPAWMAYP
jgi:N-acetylglucosaminyl-diphospho-decaprenol L-rhamnosyltransferase